MLRIPVAFATRNYSHLGILTMSWYANASENITEDSKQIITVKWTPAAPGAPSQYPLRNLYANSTHREGFWLGVLLGAGDGELYTQRNHDM